MSFIKKAIKASGNEFATIVEDGIIAGDISGYIPTISYSFNAICSGDMFKGIPIGKILMLAGEESVGKSFILLSIIRGFLTDFSDSEIVFFESESAFTKQVFINFGIDPKRVLILPVATIEDLRLQCSKIIDEYEAIPIEKRNRILFCCDSLGNLSTSKEMGDASDEKKKDTKDMTREKLFKSFFRVMTLRFGKAKTSMIVTNHTYQGTGMFATKVISGGGGPKYAASITFTLSKKAMKDESKDTTGGIVTVKAVKSRFVKENKVIHLYIDYSKGLDKYYGLLEIGIELDLIRNVSTKVEFPIRIIEQNFVNEIDISDCLKKNLIEHTKVVFNETKKLYEILKGKEIIGYVNIEKQFLSLIEKTDEKTIFQNPKKYFTEDFLKFLNKYIQKDFILGNYQNEEIEE